MGKLYIAFENETVDDIELVTDEREDVIEQLDRRRIAASQINDIAQSSDDNVDPETLVRESLTDGLESHTALHILTKSVIQGIKTCGLANENIAELAIANKNACLLMRGYYNLFTSSDFNELLTGISEIGMMLFPEDSGSEISTAVVENGETITRTMTVYDYCKTLGETKSKLEATLKDIIDEFDNGEGEIYTSWKTETVDSLENSEVRAVVVSARDQCNTYLESINTVFELITNTINGLDDNNSDSTIKEELEHLKGSYESVCRSAEADYFADKVAVLEAIAERCYAFEGFRDSSTGRLIVRIFNIVKIIIKSLIKGVVANVVSVCHLIQTLINTVKEFIMKFDIDKKMTAIKSAGLNNVVYKATNDSQIIGFITKDDKPIYYSISNGVLSTKLSPIKVEDVPSGGKSTTISFRDYKELASKLLDFHKTYHHYTGVYISPKGSIEYAVASVEIVSEFKSVIIDYIKNGNYKDIESFVDMLAMSLARTGFKIPDHNMFFDIDFNGLKHPDVNPSIEVADRLIEKCRKYKEWCVQATIAAAIGSDKITNVTIFELDEEKVFRTLVVNLPKAAEKAERSISDLHHVISDFTNTEVKLIRAEAARECTTAVSTMLKFLMGALQNTMREIKRVNTINISKEIIAIKMIDNIYKTIKE